MAHNSTDLIRIGKNDIRPAGDVLFRAFQKYPPFKYYYPDERRRLPAIQYLNLISVYYGFRFGEIYTTSANMEGVAIWVPSADYNMSYLNLLRAVPLHVLLKFGISSGSRMAGMGEYLDAAHRRLAPFKHWYLFVLGVAPEHQGQGYSSRLLRPMLARADAAKLPCYLETNDPADVPIYAHFGFKVLEESTIPGTPVKNWAMLRTIGGA